MEYSRNETEVGEGLFEEQPPLDGTEPLKRQHFHPAVNLCLVTQTPLQHKGASQVSFYHRQLYHGPIMLVTSSPTSFSYGSEQNT